MTGRCDLDARSRLLAPPAYLGENWVGRGTGFTESGSKVVGMTSTRAFTTASARG